MQPTSNLSKDSLSTEIQQSLEALQTDYLDIYLLHRDELQRPVEEIVETMQFIREIGKVKVLGVANWNVNRIQEANSYAIAHHLELFRVVQTWWSLAEYTDSMWNDPTTTHTNPETYSYMLQNHMLGMAYTSQCKGYFQKGVTQGRESISDFLKSRIETQTNIKKLEYIKVFCEKNEVSPTCVVNGYI